MTVPANGPRDGVIPLHPERTDNPRAMRWVTPATPPPFLGAVAAAPGLADLPRDWVAAVVADPGAVVITLTDATDWSAAGTRVRTALTTALSHPERWIPGPGAVPATEDELLRRTAAAAIDGPIGEVATAHGGSIELLAARDGVVSVRMHGACHGCSAASLTLHQRLERELARRNPSFRRVVDIDAEHGESPSALLRDGDSS